MDSLDMVTPKKKDPKQLIDPKWTFVVLILTATVFSLSILYYTVTPTCVENVLTNTYDEEQCAATNLYKSSTITVGTQSSISFTDITGINEGNCLLSLYLLTELDNMVSCTEEETYYEGLTTFTSQGFCLFTHEKDDGFTNVVDIMFNNVYDTADPDNNGMTSFAFSEDYFSGFSSSGYWSSFDFPSSWYGGGMTPYGGGGGSNSPYGGGGGSDSPYGLDSPSGRRLMASNVPPASEDMTNFYYDDDICRSRCYTNFMTNFCESFSNGWMKPFQCTVCTENSLLDTISLSLPLTTSFFSGCVIVAQLVLTPTADDKPEQEEKENKTNASGYCAAPMDVPMDTLTTPKATPQIAAQ